MPKKNAILLSEDDKFDQLSALLPECSKELLLGFIYPLRT